MEVSEPDETTTINVRLNPRAKPEDRSQEPPSVVEVEFATTVVLVKPIESIPVEKPLPEITAVEKKNTANSPPKWMSSSTKNNSEESTDTEGRNNEKLNLTNRLNSVIGNGNFEKAPEIVVESKDTEEEVKAKPKWKRPGTSTGEPKTTGAGANTSKLGGNATNSKTVATKKESNNEVQQKQDLPKSPPAVASKKTNVAESQTKTSVDPKKTGVSSEPNTGKKPEETNGLSEGIKETKPKPKWKRPGTDAVVKKSPESTKKENPPSLTSKKTQDVSNNRKDPTESSSSTNAKVAPSETSAGKKAPPPSKDAPKSSAPNTKAPEEPKGSENTIPTKKLLTKEVSAKEPVVVSGKDSSSTKTVQDIKDVNTSKESKSKSSSNAEQKGKLETPKTAIESEAIVDVKSTAVEKEPQSDASNSKSVEEAGTNSDPKEEDKKAEEEEEEEDASGMRAMRKEVGSKMENMEAEFAAGASKIAALRAKMKRMREAAKANKEADSRGS